MLIDAFRAREKGFLEDTHTGLAVELVLRDKAEKGLHLDVKGLNIVFKRV